MSDVREHEFDQEADHMKPSDDSAELPEWAITEGTLDSAQASQDHVGEAINEESRRISRDVDLEFRIQSQLDLQVSRVDTNYSGQVRFRTYTLGATSTGLLAVRILDDKDLRGDTVITVVSGGPVSIGKQQSITVGGADTAQIVVNASRTIRTRDELWAVAIVPTVIDVQEEFD